MKDKLKNILKYCKLPFIMSVISLLIGLSLFFEVAIGIPLKEQLLVFVIVFIPFFTFAFMTFLIYKYKEKKFLKVITVLLVLTSFFYFLIETTLCALIAMDNPITNPIYYRYYVNDKYLKQAFPKKIPKNAKEVDFYYSLGFLQAGTVYSLYYIDEDMTLDKFDSMYRDKAKWIGYKEEYTENGCLSSAFSRAHGTENDYLIYMIEGKCDDSGYCNHGSYLIAAFNQDTKEVVFSSEQW